MSFVLDALRKSTSKGVAQAVGGMLEPGRAEHYRASGPPPWLIVLGMLAAVAAGAAARSWWRHTDMIPVMQAVVARPSPPTSAPTGIAPLALSRSMDKSASRPPLPTASGSRAQSAGRAEMPDTLRRELPQLAISGYILDKAAGSLAIIDGKVLRVGDEAAPGLRIEKIDADGVAFNYQGHRFRRR